MSNDFNIIYSFLAKFGGKDAWLDKADTNDDDVVTINEFRTLIDSNWDKNTMGKLPENDLINRFFRNFDTNNSGANKDRIQTGKGSVSNLYAWSSSEYDKMDDKVEIFVKINEVLASDTSISTKASEIFGTNLYGNAYTEWLTAVKNEVMNKLAECKPQEITSEKIAEVINSPEMNKIHTKYGAQAYIEEVGKKYADLVEHGYDITKDASLNGLVNNLVNQGAELATIKTSIDNYLAGVDAEGNESSPIVAGQRDLAGAQLRKALLAALSAEQDFEKYKAAYTSAVDDYVKDVKESAETLSDITTKTVDDLKATDNFKTKLQEKIRIQKLSEEAKSKFDNNFNTVINEINTSHLLNGVNCDSMVEVINEIKKIDWKNELDFESAISEITTGDAIDQNKYQAWIEKQIAANLEKIFTNGYSNVKDSAVDDVHTLRMDTIKKADYSSQATDDRTVDDIRLEYTQNAAIDYCDWISKKTDKHKAAIETVFGTPDYKSAIMKLNRQEIINKLDELKKKCQDIINPSNATITWDKTNPTASMKSGTSATITPTFSAKENNKNIDSTKFGLEPTCNIGTVTYDGNGSIKITAPNVTETTDMTITVYATYEGQKVGNPTTIKVTVNPIKSTMTIEDTNCGNSIIKSGHTDKERNITKTRTNAISKMKDFVEKKYQELLPNFDSSILRAAADETIRYYTSCINAISDPGHKDWYTTTLSATNADGDAFSYWYNGNNGDSYCDFAGTDTAFQLVENTCSALGSNHWYEIAIGEKALLEYFVDKYNEIAAKDGYKNNNDGGILDLT